MGLFTEAGRPLSLPPRPRQPGRRSVCGRIRSQPKSRRPLCPRANHRGNGSIRSRSRAPGCRDTNPTSPSSRGTHSVDRLPAGPSPPASPTVRRCPDRGTHTRRGVRARLRRVASSWLPYDDFMRRTASRRAYGSCRLICPAPIAWSTACSAEAAIGCPTVLWQSMQSIVRRVPARMVSSLVSGETYSRTWPSARVTFT